MRINELNSRHITAEEGKVFRRISDQIIFGKEIYLGYTYYLNGEKLEVPLWELPEHYEEIDEVILEDTPDEVFDTETQVLIDPETSLMSVSDSVEQPLEPTQVRLTELLATALNEIESLKKEVAELKK